MLKSGMIRIESVEPDKTLRSDEGWHSVTLRWLIHEAVGAELGVLGHAVFPPGARHEAHIHENVEEYLLVTKSRGLQVTGKDKYEVEAGDVVFVPRGVLHETMNASKRANLEFFFVYAGAPSLEKSGYKTIDGQ